MLAAGVPVLIPPSSGAKGRAIRALTRARMLWLAALALPWVLPGRAVGAFLAIYAVNRGLDAVGAASWLTWMSGLVPAGIRGRYFARRNAVMLISGLVTGIAAAAVLDRAGRTRGSFAGVLGFTVLLSLVSAVLMRLQPEGLNPERRGPEREYRASLEHWIELLTADGGRFGRFLLFFTLWGLGNGLSQPFWSPVELQVLKVSFSTLAVISAAGSLAGALTLPVWGRLADRIGDRTVLVATIAWGSFHPILWYFMTPERLWPLWVDAISSGIVWNGFELAATNLLLRLAPRGAGEIAYGSLAAVRGIAGAISSLAAGVLVSWLPGWHGLSAMQVLLVGAAPVRWTCLALVWLVDDPRKRAPVDNARALR